MKAVLAGDTSSAARAAVSQLSLSPSSITLSDRLAQGRSSVTEAQWFQKILARSRGERRSEEAKVMSHTPER